MINELQLITSMEKNDAFARKRYTELQKRYANEYVAIDNGRVIAHSKSIKALSEILSSKGVELTTVLVQFIPKMGLKYYFKQVAPCDCL
jgi:hypothetical protein